MRRVFIGLLAIAAGGAAVWWFTKKQLPAAQPADNKKIIGTVEKKSSNGSILLQIRDPSSKDFAIVFGGTPSTNYGAAFMKSRCEKFLQHRNVAYSNWENTPETVTEFVKEHMPESKPRSVVGFSKGGLRAWPATAGDYDFVGIIDPSIEGNYATIKPTVKNIALTYLPNRNWGMAGLNHAIKLLGERAIAVPKVIHLDQVVAFMQKFGNQV